MTASQQVNRQNTAHFDNLETIFSLIVRNNDDNNNKKREKSALKKSLWSQGANTDVIWKVKAWFFKTYFKVPWFDILIWFFSLSPSVSFGISRITANKRPLSIVQQLREASRSLSLSGAATRLSRGTVYTSGGAGTLVAASTLRGVVCNTPKLLQRQEQIRTKKKGGGWTLICTTKYLIYYLYKINSIIYYSL